MGWGGGGSAQLRTAGIRKEAGDGGLHRTAWNSRVWLERARENLINSSSSPPPLTDLFLRSDVLVWEKKRSICGTKVGMLEPQGRHSVAGRPAWTHGRPGPPIKGTQRPETDGLVIQGRPPAFRGQEQLGQSAQETKSAC